MFPFLLAIPFAKALAAHIGVAHVGHAAAHVANAASHAASQGVHAAHGFIAAHGAHMIANEVAKKLIEKLCEEAGMTNEGFRKMLAIVSVEGVTITALFECFCGTLENECPKRKDGHPDMRYKKSKMWEKMTKGEYGAEVLDMING